MEWINFKRILTCFYAPNFINKTKFWKLDTMNSIKMYKESIKMCKEGILSAIETRRKNYVY